MTGTTPVIRSTRHVFLDLPALTPDLDRYHASCAAGGGWTSNCAMTTAAWMRDGLKPRCISRDLRWGTRVPREGELGEKVLYVWFDAPVGYVSITANLTRGWESWWRPREGTDVELVQFMGKDNVPFHTVIFPATLLGASRAVASTSVSHCAPAAAPAASSFSATTAISPAGNGASDDPSAPSRPWALARAISVTEYLNYEGGTSPSSSLVFSSLSRPFFSVAPPEEETDDLTRGVLLTFRKPQKPNQASSPSRAASASSATTPPARAWLPTLGASTCSLPAPRPPTPTSSGLTWPRGPTPSFWRIWETSATARCRSRRQSSAASFPSRPRRFRHPPRRCWRRATSSRSLRPPRRTSRPRSRRSPPRTSPRWRRRSCGKGRGC